MGRRELIKSLTIFGLVAIPFYEVLLQILTPTNVKTFFPDTRIGKEFITLGLSLAIGLFGIFSQGAKPFRNKCILLFILFGFISIGNAPAFTTEVYGKDFTGIWGYKPMFQYLVYFLFLLAIYSYEWTQGEIERVFKTIMWVGAIIGGYMILQSMKAEQFFIVKPWSMTLGVEVPNICGTLGQPTLAGAFIAICLPFAYYFRNYLAMGVMLLAIFLTKSDFAYLSVGCGAFLLLFRNRKHFFYAVSVVLIAFLVFSVGFIAKNPSMRTKIQDNGRFEVWGDTVKDISSTPIPENSQKHSFLGFGPGSFGIIFPYVHQSTWDKTHNEPLQLLYEHGFIGLFLFLLLVGGFLLYFFKNSTSDEEFYLSIAFISSLILALGTFVYQLPAHQFYLVLIVGLIMHFQYKENQNEVY